MSAPHLVVEQGSIFTYRLFDVGMGIDVAKAARCFEAQDLRTATLKKSSRLLLINEHPVHITLPSWEEDILGHTFLILTSAKVWSFGAISIRFSLEIEKNIDIVKLTHLSHFLENDVSFHQEAVRRVVDLMEILKGCIEMPKLWPHYEDYIIFNLSKATGLGDDLRETFLGSEITSLILGEKFMEFAPEFNKTFANNIYQYSKDDLVLIHWNGAVIYDKTDAVDIAGTIEYALCQLLEMRYCDDFLGGQLKELYQSIEKSKAGLFHNPYQKMAKVAALQYIEISELVDRINNAFKTLGDFYYATIYRSATEKLRIHDWRQSVDAKLENLAEFSKLFKGEINEKRTLLLELVIVFFFAIEMIPLIYSFVKFLFSG